MQLQWRYFHIAGDSGPRTRLRLDDILVTSGLPSGGPASFVAWIADPSFGVPAERQGPHDDPAGDGMANFLKFAFGLHPMVPSAHAGPVMALSINGPTPFLTLSYRQRMGGHGTPGIDYVADGLRYTVQVNDSLDPGSWRVDSAIIESDGLPLSNDDGTETVTIRGPLPEAPGQPRFLRLRVTEE